MSRYSFFFLFIFFYAPTLWGVAQPRDLRLEGSVLDPEGGRVPSARVELTAAEGIRQVIFSDGAGQFVFDGLPVGEYRIEVSASGFEPFLQQLSLDQNLDNLEVRLGLKISTQEVVVSASLPEFAQELEIQGRELEEKASLDTVAFFRSQPGLAAFRRGSINFDPVIRGLQETQVGMFVNGTRTFAAGPARMDSGLSHISPHLVQSVRAIKGPYALSWGSGTLSAIQVETFQPPFYAGDFQFHGKLGYQFGENADAQDGFGSLWGGDDRIRFHLFYNRRDGNDYQAGDGSRVPGDYESNDLHWSLGFRLSPELVFDYSGGYQEQNDLDFPGRLLDATYFYTRSNRFGLTWSPAEGPVSEITGHFYLNRKDHLMNNDEKPTALDMPGRTPPIGLRVDLPTESNTLGANFSTLLERGPWDFRLGFDFYNLDQTAQRFISARSNNRLIFQDIVWPDADLNDQGLYGQILYQGEKAQIGGSVRLDFVQSAAGQVSDFFQANTFGDLNQDETNVSAAFSARWRLHEHWLLTAGVGRSVRTANVLERYSDRFPSTRFQIAAEFMGNPTLEPEASLEFDLGAEFSLAQTLFKVETFFRKIDDYITVFADETLPKRLPLSPPTVFRYINGTEAHFYGAEVSIHQGLGQFVTALGSLSTVWAEDALFNEPAMGIPPLWGGIGLRLHSADLRAWVEFNSKFVDEQSRVASTRLETRTPGYALFDVRGNWDLSAGWLFRAGLENIGDRHYTNHLNSLNPFNRQRIPELGRNFYIGLTFSF